jgi:hypothetical protein
LEADVNAHRELIEERRHKNQLEAISKIWNFYMHAQISQQMELPIRRKNIFEIASSIPILSGLPFSNCAVGISVASNAPVLWQRHGVQNGTVNYWAAEHSKNYHCAVLLPPVSNGVCAAGLKEGDDEELEVCHTKRNTAR